MRTTSNQADKQRGQRGQVLAIFAGSIVLFVGILAVVIDVSWYWSNSLRVQRAADAAALAGVIALPGNVPNAQALAYAESKKNGYPNLVGGVVVTPTQDGNNPRQLDVTVSAPVNTFFMRLFGSPRSPRRAAPRRSSCCLCRWAAPWRTTAWAVWIPTR